MILAYNNGSLVGARSWNGEFTDIPVMGYDETDENTTEFCHPGQKPDFVLYKSATGEYIDLDSSDIQSYEHNQVYLVNSLSDFAFPFEVSLHAPYPNPFNPVTNIEYDVPFGGANISIGIYDIRGRLVNELINEFHEAKLESYKVSWNANDVSSGVYFVSMKSGNDISTKKIMLIK